MKQISNLFVAALAIFLLIAEPALAQSIDLSPIQSLLQGIVDALTGPLGVVIATLAVLGVFLSWFFNIIDLRQALWVLVGIAGVAAAPTIVAAVFAGGERSPLSRPLRRPSPGPALMYAMVWLFGSVLLFVWVQHIAVLAVAALLYPVLWKAADWDPRFIDVMMTALQETPPTRNRSIHGGDSYAP